MKKFIAICLAAIVALTTVSVQEAYAGQKAQLRRELRKEYKNKMKEYKKGKWQIANSSRSLEVALLKHYEQLNDDKQEIVGNAQGVSENLLQSVALNNACIQYARLAGNTVRGRITSDGAVDATSVTGAEEFDRFYQAYESLVEKEIRGELKPSYSVVRVKQKNKDGKIIKEYKAFYLIDEEAAVQARIRSWEAAKKESEVAQRYANQISNFVREGFKVE